MMSHVDCSLIESALDLRPSLGPRNSEKSESTSQGYLTPGASV